MADGEVRIDVTVDDSDAKKTLEDIEDKAKDTGESLEDLGDSAEKGGKGLGLLDVAAGNLLSGGISGLISGIGEAITSLVNLAEETREFREDMAKLETAFKTAGHSTEDAKAVYEDFYAILGESDRSVEAVNHLAELTDNTAELSQWSTICAGVTAKFGDSLPIEGLTEAANETAKVGAVTGPLADALNWAGISEDKFNEALKKCNSEQERATLITNTLSGEYSAAADEYNTLTASTQAARRATAEMEEAQARMGEAIEPFATGLTTLKAELMNYGATILENVVGAYTAAKESASILSEEQLNLINTTIETSEKMREMKLAADEAALGVASQYNYVQTLASELLTLADANGQVLDADKARVEFILGELNEALGTEYQLTGNIINNYSTLKDSVYEVIEAKKAQILLAEYEEVYAEAVKNVSEQERARTTQAIELGELLKNYEEEALKEKQLRAEAEIDLSKVVSEHTAQYWGNMIGHQANNTEKAKKLLEEKQEKYSETDKAVKDSTLAISTYEQASTLILQGETEKALKLLDDYGNGFLNAAADVDKSKKSEIETLKQKVIETSTNLGLLEAEYKKNQSNMTAEQKAQMEKRIEQARKEAQDAMAEAKTIGGNLIEGITQGANGKEWTLTGALKGIVSRAIQAAKDAAGIKSPSRVFRDEVGKMIVAGIEVGIEENKDLPIEAMTDVFDEMDKHLEKREKEQIKTVADYNAEYRQTVIDHNKELEDLDEKYAVDKKKNNDDFLKLEKDYTKIISELDEKYAEDKKKNNADTLKLDKDYSETVAELAEKYAENKEKSNEDLIKLDKDYAKDLANLNEKLSEDKQKKNANYAKLDKEYNKKKAELDERYAENKKKINDGNIKEDKEYNKKKAELDERYAENKEKLNDNNIKLDKEYNKKKTELDEKHTEDKNKINENRIKLDKDYAEKVEGIKEKHADNLAKLEDQIRKTVETNMKELTDLEKKYKEDVKKIWDDLSTEIDKVQANYDNQLKSRTESIANSLNLFKEATKNKVSISDLRKNLKSQVNVLESYNKAITKLEGKTENEDFLNYIKGLGVGSTGEIETLAKMSENTLASYIEMWEKKNELAKAAATEELEPLKAETDAKITELTDAALEKYAELRKEFVEQSGLLMAELQQAIIDAEDAGYDEMLSYVEEYNEAGGSLMDGIIEGIVDKSPVVTEAVKSAVRRAIAAAKEEAGIHSPSDVTKDEIGANLALGVGEGWKEKLHSLKNSLSSSLSDTLTRLRATVAAENGRFATSPGIADTGFNDLARAVGVQTAGINSLAGAYKSGGNNRPVILQLNGRELGRAIVDIGGAEETRRGVKLSTGGAY